ncbi:O-antigen ligase family protein [Flavobacterium sp. RSSB_23]|uniref:O-antigen ligase family protein n=1 Tax=Flavobacterium sp. RSSB_23 TaxID=3447668 RepID=UPI003F40BA3B
MNILKAKKMDYSAYIGILLLYVKLFFVEPFFVSENIDITASILLLLIILLRVFFKLLLQNVNVFGFNKAARVFWIYILFSTLSSFFLSPSISSGVVTVNLQLFLIYLLFIDFKSINIDTYGIKKVINSLVYFAIINTLLVYYTFFFGKIGILGEISSNETVTRAFGLMGDQLPWFLSFFAIYALYSKKTPLFVFFAIGILMGASVGATIVLVVSSAVYLLKGKKIQPSFYIKAGFLLVFFILLLLFSPSVFNKIGILQRYNNGDFAGKDAQTTGHRFNAISTALENISERPLLGYQNYSLTMYNKYDKLLSDVEKGDLTFLTTPNNQILAVICDYGFIGFIAFVFFIYGLIKIVRVKCMELPTYLDVFKKSAYVWLTVFILFNQSATWFLPGSFLWILICIVTAISYKINQIYGVR